MVVFRVAALCAERVKLGLGLAALAEHGDEGRRVFGEVDIPERLRKRVDLRPDERLSLAKIMLGCPFLHRPR